MQTMRKGKGLFFCDTVTLSNFCLSNSLDLLVKRYGKRFVLTDEVLDKIAGGIVAGYAELVMVARLLEEGSLGRTALTAKEWRTKLDCLRTLGSGESSCIACAFHRKGTVMTDDRAARKCCEERRIPFTGTVGLLLAFCRDGDIDASKADAILERMVERGFYSPVKSIASLF